jgi:hypothetical protein
VEKWNARLQSTKLVPWIVAFPPPVSVPSIAVMSVIGGSWYVTATGLTANLI